MFFAKKKKNVLIGTPPPSVSSLSEALTPGQEEERLDFERWM